MSEMKSASGRKLFLTSSPTGPLDNCREVIGLDEMNGFRSHLRALCPNGARCLIITASPYTHTRNDEMTAFFRNAMALSGISCPVFDLWDSRETYMDVNAYDIIWLGGGHVPTQNRWFEEIGLAELLRDYHGIVIGISAGTMNCAAEVYSQPEEPGEAVDPDYRRFMPGLGLTVTNVIPHYQMTKDLMLDGMRLFDDITLPDSIGREFIVLTDGAYIYAENGVETVYGEALRIRNGHMEPLCQTGASVRIH